MRWIGLLSIGIFLFSVGIFVGQSRLATPSAGNPPTRPHAGADACSGLKAKLQAISDTDIADYHRLKSLEEKYQKADDILSKIMALFVADLGLRSSVKKPTVGASAVVAAAPESPPKTKVPVLNQTVAKAGAALAGAPPKDTRPLSDLRGPQDESDFLGANKIEDLEKELRGSPHLSSAEIVADLNGAYHGTAQVQSEGKPHTWTVTMSLSGHFEGSSLHGDSTVEMSEGGNVFSKQGDNGELTSYKEGATDKQIVFVRASPTTYFQMYYLKISETLIGNVYRRPEAELPFAYIGTISLQKTR